jgi:4,5-DOPA dioxygenase extradiol
MFALEPGSTGPALTQWAQQLLQAHGPLRGVVVLSPHWMARTPAVMINPKPATWHDFGGFAPELYKLQYPAPGSVALGQEVLVMIQAAGMATQGEPERPMDHGAWVPLMHLFPQADVPVVQVALPLDAGPREVYALGAALQGLRSSGVLILGSGSMTHNLGEFFGGERAAAPYVLEFSRWIEDALQRGDLAALLDYRAQAPHAVRAHPSDDHFLPLFFALGAAGAGAKPDYLSHEVMYGMLAMDAFSLAACAQTMSYTLKLYDFEDASPQQRLAAEQRFRKALEESLGDASMVVPVYAMYQRLLTTFGETPSEDALTDAQRAVFDQWQAAESAAVTAAFGPNRYMGEPQFEIRI